MIRGYSITEKKTVYGFMFVATDKNGNTQTQVLQPDNLIGLQKMYVVNPESVEQYVHYDDIDGKPIFENDILQCKIITSGKSKAEAEKIKGKAKIYKGMACLAAANEVIPLYMLDDVQLLEEEINRGEDRPTRKSKTTTQAMIKASEKATNEIAKAGEAANAVAQAANEFAIASRKAGVNAGEL